MTGRFSLPEATLSFAWLGGGVAVGIAVTLAVTFVESRVLRRGARDPGGMTLFSLLIPFGVYLAAEAIHVSGILAAATAGIAMNYVENSGRAPVDTRMRRAAVWSTVQLALNGAIFVLLGEQLPEIFRHAETIVAGGARGSVWWLPAYALAITGVLVALRFVWVWVTLRLVFLRARFRGETREGLTWHLVASTSLAGVKGAITLAGVLTLPELLPGGQPFPARDLAVFLAMSVILLSLLLASVLLPGLLRRLRLPEETGAAAEEEQARDIAGEAAVKAIEALRTRIAEDHDDQDLHARAADRAMERYTRRVMGLNVDDDERARIRDGARAERRLRLAGLRAERAALFRLRRGREIDDALLRRLVREVDLMEARFRD